MDSLAHKTQRVGGIAANAPTHSGDVRDFPVPLMSGGIAVLRVPFPMSEDDFQQLYATLHAWKKALVKTEVRPVEPSGASDNKDGQ